MKFKYKKIIALVDFEKVFEFLTEKLKKLKFPQGFLEFLFYTISELFVNIKEHAKTDRGLLVLEINANQCLIKVSDGELELEGLILPKKSIQKMIFRLLNLP